MSEWIRASNLLSNKVVEVLHFFLPNCQYFKDLTRLVVIQMMNHGMNRATIQPRFSFLLVTRAGVCVCVGGDLLVSFGSTHTLLMLR